MKFRSKTILGIALIEIVLLAFLIISVLSFINRSNDRQLNFHANTTLRLFSSAIKDAILAYDLALLESFTQEILSNPEIAYVKIISNGIVVSEGGNKELLDSERIIDNQLSDVNDGIFDIATIINEIGTQYGEIRMGLSISHLEESFTETKKWSISIAILEVLLVAIFSFILGTYLTAQLSRLKKASEIISNKGPGYQVTIVGTDEISELSKSFNNMSNKLKLSQDKLEHSLVAQEKINQKLEISRQQSEKAYIAKKETMEKLSHEIEIRKQAERSLQESYDEIELRIEQRTAELDSARLDYKRTAADLIQLMNTANALIFSVDTDGRINDWNKTAARIMGYSKAEVMGQLLVNEIISDNNSKALLKSSFDKTLAGEETSNYELPLYTRTGDRVDVLLNCACRHDALGNIAGVISVGQDITERKQAQTQLIQSSKLASLGEMATGVAHELNQPLNIIRMASGNICRKINKGLIDKKYLHKKLERIKEQTGRAAAIIDHMRMLGRQAGNTLVKLDTGEVVHSVLGLIGEQLRLENIDIKLELPEVCPSVLGEQIQLEQVLLNLLGNARDAIQSNLASAEKCILIEVSADDAGQVRISLEDTGGGIDENIISRIFEPFYTTKEVGKGTGLGLSISYGIIRDVGGSLSAVNTGAGVRFEISLPAVGDTEVLSSLETA